MSLSNNTVGTSCQQNTRRTQRPQTVKRFDFQLLFTMSTEQCGPEARLNTATLKVASNLAKDRISQIRHDNAHILCRAPILIDGKDVRAVVILLECRFNAFACAIAANQDGWAEASRITKTVYARKYRIISGTELHSIHHRFVY